MEGAPFENILKVNHINNTNFYHRSLLCWVFFFQGMSSEDILRMCPPEVPGVSSRGCPSGCPPMCPPRCPFAGCPTVYAYVHPPNLFIHQEPWKTLIVKLPRQVGELWDFYSGALNNPWFFLNTPVEVLITANQKSIRHLKRSNRETEELCICLNSTLYKNLMPHKNIFTKIMFKINTIFL
jgi:hypothetical protein